SGSTAVQERGERPDGDAATKGGNGSTEAGSRKRVARWPALMGGVPASPWELMRRMSEEMNQLVESLGGTGGGLTQLGQATPATARQAGGDVAVGTPPILVPHIEVQQRRAELVVRADLPGLRPEDINVTVDHGVLTISGERREEHREEREGFIRSEVSYGTFFRTIPLPDGADENRTAAIFRNGVLEITVPVSEREQGRRVKVQS
ncbi:MAG TPA: Hsp20/alpha crystallin family protein, partial [Chloroflexota bacterium]